MTGADLSRWNLSEWTISGRFWRMFHKWMVSSAVAVISAPSLIRNWICSTAGPTVPPDDAEPGPLDPAAPVPEDPAPAPPAVDDEADPMVDPAAEL